jgi:DNA repair exonuclease SbcCD nuclease subunit
LSGYFNIGLLHSSLVNLEGHDKYAPCSSEQLANQGYNYWALGHIHKRQIIREASPTIVFPGNLQGRHARETGPKGAFLVEVDDDHRVTIEFRALDDVRWIVIEHQADAAADAPTILAAVASKARTFQADGRLLVLRVRLSGQSSAHNELVANRTSHLHQLRALLSYELGEDVWLEDLRVETSSLRVESADETVDDARTEVARLLADIRSEPSWFAAIVEDFAEIQDKLPAELFRGDDAVRLTDVEWLADLLDRVPPTLFHNRGESL